MKRILLIAGNYWPELTGIGKYNGEMMEWLGAHGYHCTVLATYPYYPQWKVHNQYRGRARWYSREQGPGNVNIIRCPHFIPSRPGGAIRMLSDLTISLSFMLPFTRLLFARRYDVVVVVVPSFFLGVFGVLYKGVRGATFVYHIQDLQIDAARQLGMIRSGPVLSALEGIERFMLRRAHFVSSISAGMIARIQKKINREVVFFPNWVNLGALHQVKDRVGLKPRFGFNQNDFVVLYSGAIGEKQGLELLLHVARRFAGLQHVKFLICGEGPYKERLMEKAQSMQLHNVHFQPLQPAAQFNAFLNMADVHLVIQKIEAGDLLLPSKLSAILAVGGLAVVTAQPGTSLHSIISQAAAGVLVQPEDEDALAAGVQFCLDNNTDCIRDNAAAFARRSLNMENIMKQFEHDVLAAPTAG